MRFIITLILLLTALPAWATDTALVDRDGVTQPLVLTPANIGAATAAQGAKADTAVQRGDLPEYWLSDYGNPNLGATLQAAIDDVAADGGGVLICDTPDDNDDIVLTSTLVPKSHVSVDVNSSTLKWSGTASGVMVENNSAAAGVDGFQLFNGYLDPGTNASVGFKLHSVKRNSIYDITLVSANNATFEFMQLLPDSAVGDAANGERNVVDNVFGPFLSVDNVVVKRVLTLTGSNPPWQVTTGNKFVGPWVFYAKEKGIVFKQYCDSNEFNGLFRITLANDTVPGTCVLFNDSADKTQTADVWGEHFTHLSCETWYPSLAGQKAVEINHAGGITIDYLGNDRVTQGTWPVGMVTDNYSQGHKITYVEGYPSFILKEYVKGDISVKGSGNGVTFPDGSKQTTAPDDTAYDATSWDGSTAAPTKNAVRDKVESILATAGTGNVTGPVSSTDNALAQYSGTTGRTIKDGPTLATSIGTPGSDNKVATEKAVRDALSATPQSITDSVSTTSSTTAASATAVKTAYDTAAAAVVAGGKAGGQTVTGGTGASEKLTLQSTSHATKNGILFDDNVFLDTVYARELLAMNPAVKLTSGYPGAKLHLVAENTVGADDATTRQELYSTASAFPTTAYYRARGSFASPLKLISGDRLGGIAARGYYGVAGSGGAFPSGGTAAIFFNGEEDFNDSTHLGTRITFETTATASGTRTERFRISGSGMITEGLDDYTASFTVANSTSRITLATGTATVTLPKTLPAGTTSVLVTVTGAAASGVSFAAELGGSLSWGDAGAPSFTNSKTTDVVCTSENAAATTAAAWRCVKGGNF